MNQGHGGDLRRLAARSGRPAADILDFSANINPLGPPAWLRPVIARHVEDLVHYPDPDAQDLVRAAAEHFAMPVETIVAGNGSTELLFACAGLAGCTRAIVPAPAYIDYRTAAERAGLTVEPFALPEEEDFRLDCARLAGASRAGDLVILGQPNNPTGLALCPQALRELMASCPKTLFVIDEAFADFCSPSVTLLPDLPPNAVVLRSLTKVYAIPGLRLGLGFAPPERARRMRDAIPAWSVNTLAQRVGARALRDADYVRRTREELPRLRDGLEQGLRGLPGVHLYPGCANFLLCRLDGARHTASAVADRLLQAFGIAIRVCANYEGLDERFLRVAVRTEEENARLCEALESILCEGGGAPKTGRSRPCKPRLMFQGTSSNAGKSVLTAAFCRILLQDGYDVAPFKAQNMALNSFVTRDGREMGRAQVVQAQACRLAPDVRMNPILLKPSSDTGCQVIHLGRPVGNRQARDFGCDREKASQLVRDAFDSLAAEHEVIVLEGAGSPGEVNLKGRDLVNMPMAAHARSPVLLVGDIDRGGVFASFVGTLEVLEEWERRLVRGFVANKFRGDASLLAPANAFVEEFSGKPVLGVVPYLEDLGLPEEDSVSFQEGTLDPTAPRGEDAVDVALVHLPHLSNFTDMDPFRLEPDVRYRIVRAVEDLGTPDALVLPGSKNVASDIQYLQARGLWERIRALANQGKTTIVGLCAGFQMLGESLSDPAGVEFEGPATVGLGLLPMATLYAPEKTLLQAKAVHRPSGCTVRGYEIHHGRSTLAARLEPILVREDGVPIGYATESGRVWGTYLHGIFDDDAFRRWFIDELRQGKGLAPVGQVVAAYDVDAALDRLADVVRAHVQLDRIYRIIGLA